MSDEHERDRLATALGASVAVNVGGRLGGPLEMHRLQHDVQRRLRSSGGRPTDPAWTLSRQVPFKPESWERLAQLAKEFGSSGRRVAAAQLAAVIVEYGLQELESERWTSVREASRLTAPVPASAAAEVAGVTFKQLEFWRKEGFVRPAQVGAGGQKLYSADEVVRMVWLGYAIEHGCERDDAMRSITGADLDRRYAVSVAPSRCETVSASELVELMAAQGAVHVLDQVHVRLRLMDHDGGEEEESRGDLAAEAV